MNRILPAVSSDYGTSIHYLAVKRGTPVYDSADAPVGKVREVKDNAKEHILDGFEIEDTEGTVRFVDAPEVARTFENGITLSITAAELPEMAQPVKGGGPPVPSGGGYFSKIFGR
jgi:hypothetical protein